MVICHTTILTISILYQIILVIRGCKKSFLWICIFYTIFYHYLMDDNHTIFFYSTTSDTYIYEDISIRGITEAEIYFEPRHQFESILLLKILWSFSINHFEALFLIQWLPQHIITYCYREFAKIPIYFI